MTTYIIAAITKDGFIARSVDDRSFDWTSLEDKKHYVSMIKKADAIVMGRKSFETFSRYPKDSRWIIYTSDPSKFDNYQSEVIRLEGTKESPIDLLARLQEEGCNDIAVCGGSSIYTAFLKSGKVNKMYITVEENVEFGEGIPLFNDGTLLDDDRFELVGETRIGEGTVVREYRVGK